MLPGEARTVQAAGYDLLPWALVGHVAEPVARLAGLHDWKALMHPTDPNSSNSRPPRSYRAQILLLPLLISGVRFSIRVSLDATELSRRVIGLKFIQASPSRWALNPLRNRGFARLASQRRTFVSAR